MQNDASAQVAAGRGTVTARELQVIPGQGTGGPLVNLSGQVIGITLAGSPGGAHDTSFAMPINEALTIARQLKH